MGDNGYRLGEYHGPHGALGRRPRRTAARYQPAAQPQRSPKTPSASATVDKALQQQQVLQCLNQIAVSLTHILNYNDKVVLDQEYNTIINNLNLNNIPDADIITLLQELMDLLTISKINDQEREYLLTTYDKNVQNELKNRLRSKIFDTDLLINPYTTILSAFLNVGSFYFNYRSQMGTYKKEKEEKFWQIESKTIQGINTFYKKLLKYSWDLMQRYDIADEWRLNEKQLSDYTAILKEPDMALRYRKLERIESSFQKFPPYWYYRGQAAQETDQKEAALKCYQTFQKIHLGIMRKDPYAASVAMSKTMLTQEQGDPQKVKADLERTLANSEDSDWGNILFAALQYARLGDADMAGKLILRNLDNGNNAFIDSPDMIRSVGPALLLNARADVFDRVMNTVLENDKVKNYDVLWLYGQLRNRDILKRIEPEFNRVMLLFAKKSAFNPFNLFTGDNLALLLPTRWMADNLAITLHVSTETKEQDFKSDKTALLPDFPEITVLTFENVLSGKSFIKKKRLAEISVALVREKLLSDPGEKEAYNIEMYFQTHVLPADAQQAKLIKYTNYLNSTRSVKAPPIVAKENHPKKKASGDLALWFAKEKIVLNGEAFLWTDGGVVFDSGAMVK